MDKFLETLKGLLQKGNTLLGKLPFKGLAEKYIPESAKTKVPFLETIVTPYANQIVAGLAALLLVAAVGGGGSGSSLKGSTWTGEVITPGFVDLSGFGVYSGSPALPYQTTYVFDSNTVKRNRVEFNAQGNRVNPSSKTGTYKLSGNLVTMTFDNGVEEGLIEGATMTMDDNRKYNGDIVFQYKGASKSFTPPPPPPPKEPETNNRESKSEDDYSVTLTRDGTGAVITKYNNTASIVTIPATIQGMPVKEIESGAFSGNIALASVVIPESVTRIGSFRDCRNLSSVTLPNTLRSIPDNAFYGCKALTSINLPAVLTEIGDGAFADSGLTSLPTPWPKGITRFSGGLFANSKINTLVIPEGITRVGNFQNYNELTSVTLPSTISVIEDGAFTGRSSLTAFIIPESVTRIQFPSNREWTNAFEGCGNLPLATQARLKELGYKSTF